MVSLSEFKTHAVGAVAGGLALIGVSTQEADAATVSYTQSGEVTSSSLAGVNAGDTWSWTTVFDVDASAATDAVPTTDFGLYSLQGVQSSILSVGGLTYDLSSAGLSSLVIDGSSGDLVGFNSSALGTVIGVNASGVFDASVLASDDLFAALQAGNTNPYESGSIFELFTDNGNVNGSFLATSYSNVAEVPLPAAGALLVAGIGAFGFIRRRRKEEGGQDLVSDAAQPVAAPV